MENYMTIFIIKIIACVTMVLDHIKYAIPETEGILTKIGIFLILYLRQSRETWSRANKL